MRSSPTRTGPTAAPAITHRLPAFMLGLGLLAAFGLAWPATDAAARDPHPRPAQARYEVASYLDLAYNPGPNGTARQRLDLFLPRLAKGSPPVLVFAPAGAWAAGDRTVYRPQARALAELGLGVALVDHRVSDGSPDSIRHPEHVRDLARAVGFVRSWLLVAGLDAGAVFVGGHEAGAHLGALLAADPRYLAEQGLGTADLRGVIGLSGIYDIHPSDGSWSAVFGIDPLGRREASPESHLRASTPPMLLLAAAADAPGRQAEAAALAAALIRAGGQGAAPQVAGRNAETLIGYLGWESDEATDLILQFVQQRLAARPRATATAIPTRPPSPTPTAVDALPPGLPPRGPGAARRAIYETTVVEARQVGDLAWWRVLPAGAAAEDPLVSAPLPVLVFLPAAEAGPAGVLEPYRRWLDHLALAGAVILVPSYAERPPAAWRAHLAELLPAAVAELRADPDLATRIDRESLFWAGHGEGAALALAAAADWYALGLPLPRAVFLALPRDPQGLVDGLALRRLPPDLQVLTVAAEDDAGADPVLEELLWDRMGHVPTLWRERLVLRSDPYGKPALRADFASAYSDAPLGGLDGLDGYGYWKWLDALLACSRYSADCEFAFGGGAPQLDMGEWSDGHPARPALRSAGPPRRFPWRGLLPWIGKRAQ